MLLVQIGNLIKAGHNFAIVSHTSPDGDSIGSILGLYNALKEIGKDADMFVDDLLPEKYSFLPGFNEIKRTNSSKTNYDCIFVLDCGDEDRLGKCKDLFSICDTVVNIDHHISNTLFGNLNIVDTNASSVGELVYQLLKINGFDISKNSALCLYTSILTDTGGFKYSNTTSITFSIAGDLINSGINFSEVYDIVFDMKTIEQINLMSKVTSTLEILLNGKVSIITMTQKMLNECKAAEEDSSELINIARDIKGVEVALFVKEVNNKTSRVSLRSKQFIDVSKIAEYFGGGGHIRAAGCTVEGSIEEVKSKLIAKINNEMNLVH